MCFTIHHGKHLGKTLKLPRLSRVSGASRSRPASQKLQHLVLDKILNVSVSETWVSGLVLVSAQKVSCTSLVILWFWPVSGV